MENAIKHQEKIWYGMMYLQPRVHDLEQSIARKEFAAMPPFSGFTSDPTYQN